MVYCRGLGALVGAGLISPPSFYRTVATLGAWIGQASELLQRLVLGCRAWVPPDCYSAAAERVHRSSATTVHQELSIAELQGSAGVVL